MAAARGRNGQPRKSTSARRFEYDGGDLKHGAVVIRHNDNTEIYINGQKILGVRGSKGYYMVHGDRAVEEGAEERREHHRGPLTRGRAAASGSTWRSWWTKSHRQDIVRFWIQFALNSR